jgi:hypothetical protein
MHVDVQVQWSLTLSNQNVNWNGKTLFVCKILKYKVP